MAETHPQACVSSRKFGEKTAKLHRLRELPSRGALPLVLYTQKHTQNAKINLSPILKGDTVTPVHGLFTRDDSELWVGGRAECEPRATPLSTRSILAVRRVNWLPLFPFSFVPHGRPPPFPTMCDILTFLSSFLRLPHIYTEKTRIPKTVVRKTNLPTQPTRGDLL